MTGPNSKKISLKGTEQPPQTGTRAICPTDPHQLIEISVMLKHRQQLPALENEGKILSHGEFAGKFGADPAQVDKIREFARNNNLQMLERGDEVLRRTVTLAGTAAALEKAFSVELTEFEYDSGSYRGYTGTIQMQEEYSSFVSGVFGLDNRVAAQPYISYRGPIRNLGARGSTISYNPAQVAKYYGFPQDANGNGQAIGLIELGGGYCPADIREYFQSLGVHPPEVKTVSVNQAMNRPSTPHSADGQVTLDIQVAGAVAPGASIVVYFAPNTARGFLDAMSTAIHDQLNKPRVLSIGWGSAETNWTRQAMENFDQLAQEAALLGITITAKAAGETAPKDRVAGTISQVDFPASSPHVLAAGGTRLMATNGSIESETVWNGGGAGGGTRGGYSKIFARPAWQGAVGTQSGRGVPDVAGNADPDTGYNILVDGQHEVVGGTSAVAPLWAGLIVLLNQKLNRRLGFINPSLYSLNDSTAFRDITLGSNGEHHASFGWDAVTGHGSPIGTQLLQALQGTGSSSQAQRKESTHAAAAR